jgi:hypothetical protein
MRLWAMRKLRRRPSTALGGEGSTLSPTSGRCDPENPAHRQTGNETRYTIYRLPYKPLTGERALLFGKDWLSPANRACVSAGH